MQNKKFASKEPGFMEHGRSIYRDEAIQRYIEKREKGILPHLVAPPVLLFLWILLGLLLAAGILAWFAQVPTYLAGSGIILEQQSSSTSSGQREATALIFFPALSASQIRAGLPIQVQPGSTGPTLTTKIDQVEPGILSPSAARTRYALDSSVSQLLTQPVVAVEVRLGPTISTQMYAGSTVSAQVQVGSRRVLSLLPGFERLIGG
jgi:anti-sigma factor RsiW